MEFLFSRGATLLGLVWGAGGGGGGAKGNQLPVWSQGPKLATSPLSYQNAGLVWVGFRLFGHVWASNNLGVEVPFCSAGCPGFPEVLERRMPERMGQALVPMFLLSNTTISIISHRPPRELR